MRRILFVVIALGALLAPARALATVPPGGSNDGSSTSDAPTTTVDNKFLDTERDLTECLNNSVPLPGCGVAATDLGDRGGVLQIVTFVVLTIGMALIGWRVTMAVRARDRAVNATRPELSTGPRE